MTIKLNEKSIKQLSFNNVLAKEAWMNGEKLATFNPFPKPPLTGFLYYADWNSVVVKDQIARWGTFISSTSNSEFIVDDGRGYYVIDTINPATLGFANPYSTSVAANKKFMICTNGMVIPNADKLFHMEIRLAGNAANTLVLSQVRFSSNMTLVGQVNGVSVSMTFPNSVIDINASFNVIIEYNNDGTNANVRVWLNNVLLGSAVNALPLVSGTMGLHVSVRASSESSVASRGCAYDYLAHYSKIMTDVERTAMYNFSRSQSK